MNTDPQTWQELLADVIQDSQERQRIATELRVHPVTISRWVNGGSSPRSHNLRHLLRVLPEEHRERFAALVTEEFSDALTLKAIAFTPQQEEVSCVPGALYERVLHSCQYMPSSLRFWSICQQVLNQALAQLDPERQGIEAIVVQCMPEHEGTVRSLREVTGQGTPPWEHTMETLRVRFLGAESLAGQAVTTGHLAVFQEEKPLLPPPDHPCQLSAAAIPLLRAGKIAGALVVCSAQPSFFSPSCMQTVQEYTNLLTLAFEDTDFVAPASLDLDVMPAPDQQGITPTAFRQRVVALLVHSARIGQELTCSQAEEIVWQQVEEELLHLSLDSEEE